MWFAVISIFPDMFSSIVDHGITSRAIQSSQVQIELINPRDFVSDNYRRVDQRPYGGGAGMVMMAEPLAKAINHAKLLASQNNLSNVPVVYLSPQGKTLSEPFVQDLSTQHEGMIFICGRYDGIDERLLQQYVDFEVSIGDYVLSGGELAAMVIMDSVIRKLPNVMGDDDSVLEDSFVHGLLDYPQYTKPNMFEGLEVPIILKSGNHENIRKWRFLAQYKRTCDKRPDMIAVFKPTKEQKKWLDSES